MQWTWVQAIVWKLAVWSALDMHRKKVWVCLSQEDGLGSLRYPSLSLRPACTPIPNSPLIISHPPIRLSSSPFCMQHHPLFLLLFWQRRKFCWERHTHTHTHGHACIHIHEWNKRAILGERVKEREAILYYKLACSWATKKQAHFSRHKCFYWF